MDSSTVYWMPKAAVGRYGDSTINCMRVAAYKPVMVGSSDIFAPPSTKQTNHWVLFLYIDQDRWICADPSMGSNGRLSLKLEAQEGFLEAELASVYTLTPTAWTMNHLLQCIIEARYDQYKFAASGQGCRHWIACVLELLYSKGFLINRDEVEAAIGHIQVVWDGYGHPVRDGAQSVPEKGAFL